MRTRRLAAVLAAATTLLTVTPVASAQTPAPEPVPPCVRETRENPVEEFTDYREQVQALRGVERDSLGRVDVERVGTSNRGRAILAATVGTGDQVVLVDGEIHGNEKTGPDAILQVLRRLGTSDAPQDAAIRDAITLVAIPKINPDGAELDRRGTDKSWEEVVADFPQLAGRPPAWNYIDDSQQGDDYTLRPGFDMNRDFHPDLDYVPQPEDFPGDSGGYGWFINDESQVLRDLYVDLRDQRGNVDVYVNLHHQGACVAQEGTNALLDVAVDWPPLPDYEFEPGAKYAEYADTFSRDLSKQLSMAAYDGITDAGYVAARYPHDPDRDLPGQARSAFAMNGTGTVLFEVRGQTHTLGQEGRVRFTNAVVAGLDGILDAVASDTVGDYDPAGYEDLPDTVDYEDPGARASTAPAGAAPYTASQLLREID